MQKRILAGITAAMIGAFAVVASPSTDAVVPVALASSGKPSVCATGFRGQPAYDRQCLKTGTPGQAAALWFDTAEGKRGHEHDSMETRRDVCRFAARHGGVRKEAAEMVNDMAYDAYRNHKAVIGWFADAAQGDCLRLGYADAESGRVPVNLHALPKGDCWFEVSYLDHKHTKINTEALCKG